MRAVNPVWILLTLGLGCFWIYDGINRGRLYAPLLGQLPEQMTVLNAYNRAGRILFPDYKASGQIDGVDSAVVVDLFQAEYRNLRHLGGAAEPARVRHIDVYRLDPEGSSWVTASRVRESSPIFTMLGLSFSWHLPAGVLFASIASACLLKRRLDRRRTELAEEQLAERSRFLWQKRESWRRKLEAWRKNRKRAG